MRVVFTAVPQTGQLTPLLPLATAFVERGDEVTCASGADAEAAVAAKGLRFREVGPPFAAWYERLVARTRGTPGDGLPPSSIERYFVPRLFGEIGTAVMLDDLLALCREQRPDLLVFDSLVFAGPLVARAAGIRAVHHTSALLATDAVLDLVADAVSPIWRELDEQVPRAAGMYDGTTVAICPPSLDPRVRGIDGAMSMRPVEPPVAVGDPLPDWLPPGDDPVVYVTLGTFSNRIDLFQLVVDALRDEPVRVVVTTGNDLDPDELRGDGRMRALRFVPQAEVLPYCVATIHHAGAGTTFGALGHGVPAVVLPQSADNFTIAERLERAGAAISLPPGDVTLAAVRRALRAVVDDPQHRRAAERLAAEIAAMPSPDEIAARLADYQKS